MALPKQRLPTSSTPWSTSPRPVGHCTRQGLRIIDEILTSYTEIFTNQAAYADPDKRRAMTQIKTLLDGVLDARGKVLVKLNVGP